MLVDVQAIQRVLRGAYEISNNVCVGFHELRRGVPLAFRARSREYPEIGDDAVLGAIGSIQEVTQLRL